MCTIESSLQIELGALCIDRNVRVFGIIALELDLEGWGFEGDARTNLILLNIDQVLLLLRLLQVGLRLGCVQLND